MSIGINSTYNSYAANNINPNMVGYNSNKKALSKSLSTNVPFNSILAGSLNGKRVLLSQVDLRNGISSTVFKADDFSSDNPVVFVKGHNNGKPFSAEININDINLENASLVELIALEGYLIANGKPRQIMTAMFMANKELNNICVFNEKFNFIALLQDITEKQHSYGNWATYYWIKSVLDSLSLIKELR